MNLQSLPVATGAPYPASMAPSSSAFSTVTTHGCFPYSTPSTAHPSLSGILPCNNNMISYSVLPEEPSGGIFSGQSPEGCADPGDIDYRVESQQIPGPGRTVDESDNRDEWFVPTDITWNWHQMAESAPVPSYPNSKSWQHDEQHMVHESVSVPSEEPQQLCPTVSPLATTNNAHCPKRAKARMRWTMEMHDRFVDAVNLLGGCESAKPKAILDIMNVEGLTRDQVKSHFQKYKLQVKQHPSEVPGTSVEMTMRSEAIPSDVQKHIQDYALQVQVEFQKKLHDMVESTMLEIRRSLLENHVMSLHELEQRQSSYRGSDDAGA
ncbi:protein PHOSPHATE STARVATION RESPONSE 2 isoform X1 [Zea mays]|nr:protein PHOSPHATE STARVATION RESPONSE 2 isoform X1 [Zea mays]ONM15934.1 Myb family transcription factor [Zea mays]|eukprot:XP_008669170.1 protein PHOSPHATE STARVATION RESPONSE 2 isoform X1 [Zea mays]